MQLELYNRAFIAIHTYFPQLINDYLEEYKTEIRIAQQNHEQPTPIINLVMMLKNMANPQGHYPDKMSEHDKNTYFQHIFDVLHSPKSILSQDKSITPADEREIKEITYSELNKIADELIKQYNLESALKNITEDPAVVQAWWRNKTKKEKIEIHSQYNQLSRNQQEHLENKKKYANQEHHYHYYYMCQHHSEFNTLDWLLLASLANIHFGAHHHIHHNIGCSGQDCDPETAAIVGLVAIIGSGIIGGIYAAVKGVKSIFNFCTEEKMVRSLYRLSGIVGLGYLGAVEGLVVGAALGSVVPGIGTAVGGILGAIFCAGLGAGIGAIATKYLARIISSLWNRHETNPTNPDKYKLTEKQIRNLKSKGQDVKVIENILHTIKDIKDKNPKNKKELNQLLKKAKQGEIKEMIKIGRLSFDPNLCRFEVPAKARNDAHIETSTSSLISTLGYFPQEDNSFSNRIISSQPSSNDVTQVKHGFCRDEPIKDNEIMYATQMRR